MRLVRVIRNTALAVLAVLTIQCNTHARGTSVDRVIVVVNEEVITQREFERMLDPVEQSLIHAGLEGVELEEELEQAREMVLDQLINAKLAVSLARRRNIEIDTDELEDRIDGIRSYYPSEDVFLRSLNEKGTNLTEFRKQIEEQMLAQELVQREISSRIVVTPGEVRDIYEKNKDQFLSPKRVRVFALTLRKLPGADLEQRKAEISEIRSGLEDFPESFKELIEKHSDGPFSSEGGDMGFLVEGQTVPEINEAVFGLEEGNFSDVVETQMGYHIFQVVEVEEPRELSFNEVRDYIEDRIRMNKFREELVDWLEEERADAYISHR